MQLTLICTYTAHFQSVPIFVWFQFFWKITNLLLFYHQTFMRASALKEKISSSANYMSRSWIFQPVEPNWISLALRKWHILEVLKNVGWSFRKKYLVVHIKVKSQSAYALKATITTLQVTFSKNQLFKQNFLCRRLFRKWIRVLFWFRIFFDWFCFLPPS